MAEKIISLDNLGTFKEYMDTSVSGQLSAMQATLETADSNLQKAIDTLNDGAYSIECSMDTSTYVITITLKDSSGVAFSSTSVDLPLETMVVSGSYDASEQCIDLTLQSGTIVHVPVADLVAGLASQTDLDAEVSERKAADSVLETEIIAVASDLSTETTARTNADTALETSISTETAARTSADETLTTAVASEESARIAADEALSSQIAGISVDLDYATEADIISLFTE